MFISCRRRFVLAFVAIALSAAVFHRALADALVTRGDERLYVGDVSGAAHHYARALWFDGDSEVAADRLAFTAVLDRSANEAARSIEAARRYVSRHPASAAVRADIALYLLKIRRYRDAAQAFRIAAEHNRSAQTYTFAGWAALRAGNPFEAKRLWRTAISVMPAYLPARRALAIVR